MNMWIVVAVGIAAVIARRIVVEREKRRQPKDAATAQTDAP